MSTTLTNPQRSQPLLDLDVTIISAKHLKNITWHLPNSPLKPYAVLSLDPLDRRFSTKPDESGSTKPVWNERFTLPLPLPVHDCHLTIEVFHSKPSDTPKPLIGSLRIPLRDIPDPDDSNRIRSFDLRRPSGRPHGKIRLKLGLTERPLPPPQDYRIPPPGNYYYTSAPPLPLNPAPMPPRQQSYPYTGYATDSYSSGYYPGYYPPPTPRPFLERQQSYGGGPSAPVDYGSYERRGTGNGTGSGVGSVVGAMGGLALGEGAKREEERGGERVESDVASRDGYGEYRGDHWY